MGIAALVEHAELTYDDVASFLNGITITYSIDHSLYHPRYVYLISALAVASSFAGAGSAINSSNSLLNFFS